MGLLGGFKGKLIGKSKKKDKNGKNQVVCIKFNTFSEFDSDSVIPSCSTDNLGRNDVVRVRGRPSKPEVMAVFERQMIPEATTVIDKPVGPEVKTRFNEQLNGDVNKEEHPKSATKFQKPKKAQAPKASTPAPAKKASEPEQEIRNNEASPVPILATQTIQFPLQVSDDDDEDNGRNFKIHFSTNRNNNFGDLSDGDSYNDNNEEDLSPINYSSQATSIFFGGDEEPIVMRPRKVVVNDADLSDGSSASA